MAIREALFFMQFAATGREVVFAEDQKQKEQKYLGVFATFGDSDERWFYIPVDHLSPQLIREAMDAGHFVNQTRLCLVQERTLPSDWQSAPMDFIIRTYLRYVVTNRVRPGSTLRWLNLPVICAAEGDSRLQERIGSACEDYVKRLNPSDGSLVVIMASEDAEKLQTRGAVIIQGVKPVADRFTHFRQLSIVRIPGTWMLQGRLAPHGAPTSDVWHAPLNWLMGIPKAYAI